MNQILESKDRLETAVREFFASFSPVRHKKWASYLFTIDWQRGDDEARRETKMEQAPVVSPQHEKRLLYLELFFLNKLSQHGTSVPAVDERMKCSRWRNSEECEKEEWRIFLCVAAMKNIEVFFV